LGPPVVGVDRLEAASCQLPDNARLPRPRHAGHQNPLHGLSVRARSGRRGAPYRGRRRARLLVVASQAMPGMRKYSADGQRSFRNDSYRRAMDEFRARRVTDALRDRGVNAHLLRGSIGQFGIRVSLPGGREAEWDTDGTAGLEAQVMRDGMLVGYVPQIEGS